MCLHFSSSSIVAGLSPNAELLSRCSAPFFYWVLVNFGEYGTITPPKYYCFFVDSPTGDSHSSGDKVARTTPGLNTSSFISPGRVSDVVQ